MSDVVSMSNYGSREIRHAISVDSGKVVQVYMPAARPGEIRLWWPTPLAVIIWLAIIWKFGIFLTTPPIEASTPASVEASFVELPEDKPAQPTRQPQMNLNSQHRPEKTIPAPKVMQPDENTVPRPVIPLEPAPVETSVSGSNKPPPVDLMHFVKQARERRLAAEMTAAQENAEAQARERGPSADEVRMANIRRNLQSEGTNGIFQIISVGTTTGKFSFRGWTSDYNNARREIIEVNAGLNGDVEHAMVRRMIELIRKYYTGDFNWESQRLGRVIVLSARLEDNTGLEEFMMREFFGTAAR